jgi:hypothetical protein
MYEHFWDQLLRFLKIARLTYTIPYDWNKSERKFVVIRNPQYAKIFKILSCLIFIHMGILVWNLIQTLQKERNVILQIISLAVAATTIFATICRWMHSKGAEEIAHFLNCMVVSATRSIIQRGEKI